MNNSINKILTEIQRLEAQLQEELHQQADKLRYQFNNGKLEFERGISERHKAFKVSVGRYILNARWLVIVTSPAIYALIIPFVLLDIFVNLYQFICFPVYGIPKVRRNQYLVFDRTMLNYLNGIEKLNCVYCSYGNGIIAFTREVAARTEQYWCPIKHAEAIPGKHDHYHKFTNFGDAKQYRESLKKIQQDFND